MSKIGVALAFLAATAATPAAAATVFDPIGDFLPSYVFDHDPDLDVTSFSVEFNSVTSTFSLGGSLAGPVDLTEEGFYVIGVNTGLGAIDPFDDIDNGNVTFDRLIVLQKDGTAMLLGDGALTAALVGNVFTLSVPLSLLPPSASGFAPENYGFNIWPRYGATVTGNDQISDFAPDNALLTANGVVPEPATWAMMLLGFGAIGFAMRRRRTKVLAQVA